MKRIIRIYNHPLYKENFLKLQNSERERKFCRHTLEHFLDTARICYIYNLENNSGIDKAVIYAAAILHDIGRYKEISEDIPHDVAGAEIADIIMKESGFCEAEIDDVKDAIKSHRIEDAEAGSLAEYLYKADKQSRNCFCCEAYDECKWSMEKRNLGIIV